MARITLIGALPQEIAAYRSYLVDAMGEHVVAHARGGLRGRWHGHDVEIATVGVSKPIAAANTTRLLLEHRADYCIFTGVAGALDERLVIGDIAVVERAVDADLDVTAWGESEDVLPYQRAELPFSRKREYQSDPGLVTLVNDHARVSARISPQARVPLVSGYVATGSAFLDAERKKRFISDVSPLLQSSPHRLPNLYDMESSAVLQAAEILNVPTLVIRAVSDTLEGDAPKDFNAFVASALDRYLPLVDHLLYRLAEKERDSKNE